MTLDDTFLSDHYLIATLFNRTPPRKSFFSHKIRHSKLLDEQFIKNFLSSLVSLEESLKAPSLNPNQKYFCFTEHLVQQWPPNSEKPRPPGRPPGRGRFSPPAPWWSGACQEAVDARRGLLSTLKKYPTFSNYLAFKKQEAITRRMGTEKRRGWREFCFNLNPSTPISHLWQFIKRFRSHHFEDPIAPPTSNHHPSNSIQSSINSLCPPSVFHRVFSSIDDFPKDY